MFFWCPLPCTYIFEITFVHPLTRFYVVYHTSIITLIGVSSLSAHLLQRPCGVIPVFFDFILCCSPFDRFPHAVDPGRFWVVIAYLASFPTRFFPKKMRDLSSPPTSSFRLKLLRLLAADLWDNVLLSTPGIEHGRLSAIESLLGNALYHFTTLPNHQACKQRANADWGLKQWQRRRKDNGQQQAL